MKRVVLGIASIGVIAASWIVSSGLASGMTDSSQTVGTGNATVTRCETSGVTTVYNLSSTNVVSVAVSNIDAACAGLTMKITLNNQSTTSSGSATVPAGGGSLTITVTSIAVTQIMQNEISVV